MLQLIFIMPSGQISPELFDVKINMLILILHVYTLSICIWSRRLKLYLRKWSLIQMSLKKHSLGLASILTTQWLAQINHVVLYMSMQNYWEISHGWGFCFLSRETWSLTWFSITGSQFSLRVGIKNQESRHATDCQLTAV